MKAAGDQRACGPDVKVVEPGELREPAVAYATEEVLEPRSWCSQPETHRWVKSTRREAG